MAKRFNKNGILILDDIGQNKLPPVKQTCLPDQHVWQRLESDLNPPVGLHQTIFRCKYCSEKLTKTDHYDYVTDTYYYTEE